MPQLPTYTAKLGDLPISGGRRASAPEGSDLGELSRTVSRIAGSYLANLEEKENRAALLATTEIRAKYARALDEAVTTGADVEKLREQMADDIAKAGVDFQTNKGVESLALYASNTSLMFDEQANRIAVQRAAATARVEGSKFLNSAGAIIQSNPTYLIQAEKDAEAFGKTLVGISPQAREDIVGGLKKELNMAAALSMARIDPEGTRKALDGGAYDLSPDQRNAAINKAESESNAKRADENFQRAQREHEQRERDEVARDRHFKGIIGGTTRRRDILDDADLLPTTREHLVLLMEQRARELRGESSTKSDPVTKRNLWLAVHAPEGNAARIYNADPVFAAVQQGRLSIPDANQLMAQVSAQKDENNRSIAQRLGSFVSDLERTIARLPEFTAQPALIAAVQLDYQDRVYKRMERLRKENQDPAQVFDAESKQYVGTPQFLKESIDRGRATQRGAAVERHLGDSVERDGFVWKLIGDPRKPEGWQKLGPAGQVRAGKIKKGE
jgi:hypothetical protein